MSINLLHVIYGALRAIFLNTLPCSRGKQQPSAAFRPEGSICAAQPTASNQHLHPAAPCAASQLHILAPRPLCARSAHEAACLICDHSALPFRPSGSICAAMLSLSNATARIRRRLLSCSKSAATFAALFCQVPHTSPKGLRLRSIAFARLA